MWEWHAPKFCGENFHKWLSNLKICESYLPQKLPVIKYTHNSQDIPIALLLSIKTP